MECVGLLNKGLVADITAHQRCRKAEKPPYAEPYVRWLYQHRNIGGVRGQVNTKRGEHLRLVFTSYSIRINVKVPELVEGPKGRQIIDVASTGSAYLLLFNASCRLLIVFLHGYSIEKNKTNLMK